MTEGSSVNPQDELWLPLFYLNSLQYCLNLRRVNCLLNMKFQHADLSFLKQELVRVNFHELIYPC